MEFENLLTLIKTVSDSELTDFDYEENGTRIRLKKKKETVVVAGALLDVPTARPLQQHRHGNPRTAETVAGMQISEPEGDDRKISAGRNFLCSTCRGCRSVCFGRRHW